MRICNVQVALLFILAALTSPAAGDTKAELPLTNANVIELTSASLAEDTIIAKINQAPAEDLDVSTNALLALKAAGVGDRVIIAMIKRADARTGSTVRPSTVSEMSSEDSASTAPTASGQESETRAESSKRQKTPIVQWQQSVLTVSIAGIDRSGDTLVLTLLFRNGSEDVKEISWPRYALLDDKGMEWKQKMPGGGSIGIRGIQVGRNISVPAGLSRREKFEFTCENCEGATAAITLEGRVLASSVRIAEDASAQGRSD